MNLLLIPTLLFAFALFVAGVRIGGRPMSAGSVSVWSVAACVVAIPALLFTAYYAHLLDNAAWFFAFRSVPYIELAASGAGFSAGLFTGLLRRTAVIRASALFTHTLPVLALTLLTLLLFAPYAKPLLAPIRIAFRDQWSEGVCLQSTPSTCGPSSAATLLRWYGVSASEQELAGECYTYGGGTENWYITRALRRRGLDARYVIIGPQPAELPLPCIAGTQLGQGGAGHFIALLAREGDRYIVGDPLTGRRVLTLEQMKAKYYLTGFFLVVQR